MKYMSKGRVIRKHAVDNVLQEAQMLKMLNHPFLVNLWFAFQDQEDLFLVVDLLLGGDLSWHVEQDGRLDVNRVKLYLAEIALALQYLRTKSIIHRCVQRGRQCVGAWVRACVSACVCVQCEGAVCACMCACMHACVCACMHACVCACMHACVCVCMRACMQTIGEVQYLA